MCECEHESEHEQVNGNRRAARTQSRDRIIWENFYCRLPWRVGIRLAFGGAWHWAIGALWRCARS